VDQPLLTFTAKGERGLVKAEGEFITPNFGEAPGQEPRTHSADDPVPTVTSHGAGGVVRSEAYIVPHHAGSKKDWVKGVDSPVSTVTTTMTGEGLVEPAIVQLKGQSTAQSIDSPLTALTASQGHYVMQPEIATLDNQRGTGVCKDVDSPLRTSTAGGCNQAIAEAFMFAIDQTGGARGNDGTYPVDAPVRTIVTKANQTCIEVELEVVSDRFLHACSEKGVDTSRATTFLNHLVTELKRRGKVDAKPWIYVYYSNGSEGKSIDEPLPTVRTKAGHALVYPVIELDGKLIKIDLFYRMLTPLELQRAMGFPDSMTWANCNKSEIIRAIGNSVSRGVSRAIGLAWYSQDSNVWDKVKPIYEAA
jgi:DNA (cytosine-5)-methyltransferase 1